MVMARKEERGDGSSGWSQQGAEHWGAGGAAQLPVGLPWPGMAGAVRCVGERLSLGGCKAAAAGREVSTELGGCLSSAAGREGAAAWRQGAGTRGSTDLLRLALFPSASSAAFKHGQRHPGAGLSGHQLALLQRGQLLHASPRRC